MISPIRIAVLLTCHNRREFTLSCLRHLKAQKLPENVRLETVLVDDGSGDGTSEAVSTEFPETRVVKGPGNLYWCGGMRVAWQHAAESDPDYYLLVNDDTDLDESAISELLALTGPPDSPVIAVASIADRITGESNYGGIAKGWKILPPEDPRPCVTFNANCTLVPRRVYRSVGNLHGAYTHSMGDVDYGIHATRQGIRILKSTRFLGRCGTNPVAGTWCDATLPRSRRFKLLQQPKGLPMAEWFAFTRRNMPFTWPYHFLAPFARIILGR